MCDLIFLELRDPNLFNCASYIGLPGFPVRSDVSMNELEQDASTLEEDSWVPL